MISNFTHWMPIPDTPHYEDCYDHGYDAEAEAKALDAERKKRDAS